MLVGLVLSLKNAQVISDRKAALLIADVVSDGWYPMSIFFSVLDEIRSYEIDLDPILFHAGSSFVRDWFQKFGGSQVFPSAEHFIRTQGRNGGYTIVHRGDPEEIGWQDLLEFDEARGHAKIVCITPYPREFERGLFHCGVSMAGNLDYVRVDSVEEPYAGPLSKKTITISYRPHHDWTADAALDGFLATLSPAQPVVIPAGLQEALAWRLKAAEEQHRRDQLFYEQSSLLLSKATDRIYELSQKLKILAHQDDLTGMMNRRALLEATQSLLVLAARQGWPVAFIMLDLDHFKRINDTWGHATGDATLRQVADILKERLRSSDLLGRIGGEEFLVVLPQAGLNDACALAEDLRATVERQRPTNPAQPPVQVTVSLGVTVAEAPQKESMDDYLMQADQALYCSKRNGRNQVTAFEH